MRQYLHNLEQWAKGFRHLKTLPLKPGWTPFTFGLLYATDYLACCLILAGPVTSISRYTQDHWFNSYHGAHTGPDLWGTRRCAPGWRVLIPAVWAGLLTWAIW